MKEFKIEVTYRIKDEELNNFISERQEYNDKYQRGDKYDVESFANTVCSCIEDNIRNNDELCYHASTKLISINNISLISRTDFII